jgi:hypothetical protein
MRAMMSKHDLNKSKWISHNLAYASVGSILVPTYPTVTSSRLWLDRNANVFSDTAGTTPSSINGSIGSWRAVGGAWGTDLLTQATGSQQPTLRTDGIQSDGVDDNLVLPAPIALTGDFTCYWVSSRAANTQPVVVLAGNNASSNFSFIKEAVPTNLGTFSRDDGGSTSHPDTEFNASGSIKRMRRSGSTVFLKVNGASEASATNSGTATMRNALFADFSTSTSSVARVRQIVLVLDNILDGSADDLAIRARLLSLEPGAVDL